MLVPLHVAVILFTFLVRVQCSIDEHNNSYVDVDPCVDQEIEKGPSLDPPPPTVVQDASPAPPLLPGAKTTQPSCVIAAAAAAGGVFACYLFFYFFSSTIRKRKSKSKSESKSKRKRNLQAEQQYLHDSGSKSGITSNKAMLIISILLGQHLQVTLGHFGSFCVGTDDRSVSAGDICSTDNIYIYMTQNHAQLTGTCFKEENQGRVDVDTAVPYSRRPSQNNVMSRATMLNLPACVGSLATG